MKNLFLVSIIAFFVAFTQAQENKFAANRADNAVSLITKNMQISDSNIDFLRETLYNKYASNALKIRGKNLTEDEKKQVYRSAFTETRKKLMNVFTNEEVKKIVKLEKESFKK
tara:strand:+ start:3075 stop:3413 length:339 start_codon:yes stop_codon:yes gene_type:complete